MSALKAKDFTGNEAEDVFMVQLADAHVQFIREFQFLPDRKFRLDYALEKKCAVEIDGAIFTQGAHSRPLGILRDLEKHNLAILAGWRVLRVTPAQVKSGEALSMTKQLLGMP